MRLALLRATFLAAIPGTGDHPAADALPIPGIAGALGAAVGPRFRAHARRSTEHGAADGVMAGISWTDPDRRGPSPARASPAGPSEATRGGKPRHTNVRLAAALKPSR